MAIELEYLKHLRLLVSSFDNDDGDALIGIVGKARTRIQELVAANDNEKREHLFSGKYVFIHLGESDYSIIDLADYHTVENYVWAKTGKKSHIYAQGKDQNGHYKLMHRVILDAPKGQIVDHINGKCLDNRRSNLRIVTASQNSINKKISTKNTSGFKGVSFHKGDKKWRACIKVNGVSKFLGSFNDKLDAASAYAEAAKVLHGEYARAA